MENVVTRTSLVWLASLLLLIPNSFCSGQDEPAGSSRFVLNLNDSNVASLKSLGMIQSNELGPDMVGNIAAIQLQFSGSVTDQAVIVDTQVSLDGNACEVVLTDAIIDTARKQPIRIQIPNGTAFSRVFIKYEVKSNDENAPPVPALNSQGSASRQVPMSNDAAAKHFVKLSTENQTIAGQMDLSDSIKFDTKFGAIDISLGQIRGIRFHVDGEDAAMVVLKNGDTITGVPKVDAFTLQTSWGRAELDVVFVEAITTSATASFTQTNDPGFGPRWQLFGG